MKLGRPLGILLVSASLVMTIGWLSRAPYDTPGSDAAVLRLSWRFRGEKEEECRPRAQAELDVLPVHMRTPEICEGHLSAYRLNVQIGNRHVASRVFVPQGAKGDRPIFVMQEMNLSSGPQRVRVALDCGWDGEATSHNVIGEITGSETPEEVVLIGAHLDSWDLGTGAVDDAAGVGITMAAAKLIGDLPRHPARSIRVVAFANEEQGLLGGRAYAEKHAADLTRHVIAAESDFGAGRVYAFATGAPESARAAEVQIAAALAPLGIEHAPGKGGPGPDLIPFAGRGMAWAWLAQDGTDYFDLHHTPDDTFDKIDPEALAQNVAAYAVFAYLAASAEGGFGSAPKPAGE